MTSATQAEKTKKPHVLLLGLDANQRALINPLLVDCVVTEQPAQVRAIMDHPNAQASIIICGKPTGETSYDEIVQLLRMLYQEQFLFFVCTDRAVFNRFRFIRNGATDAFLLPIDAEIFKRGLSDSLERASHGTKRSYQPIKLLDIEAGKVLDFDVYIYFPTNERYIRYVAAHTAIEDYRVKQLHAHEVGTLNFRTRCAAVAAFAQTCSASITRTTF